MDHSKKDLTAYYALIVGVFFYEIYGVAHLLHKENLSSFFLNYFLTGVVCLTVGYLLQDKYNASVMLVFSSLLALANTFYASITGGYSDSDLLFSMALMFGVVDFCWLMTRVYALSIFFFSMLFALSSFWAVRENTQFDILMTVPFLTLFFWRSFMAFFQNKAYQAEVRFEQFNSFRATIATLNHEFANISAIVIANITIIKRAEISPDLIKKFETLENALQKFIKTINDFKKTEQYNLDREIGGTVKMVKINKSDAESD
jgi:hypothetical protein